MRTHESATRTCQCEYARVCPHCSPELHGPDFVPPPCYQPSLLFIHMMIHFHYLAEPFPSVGCRAQQKCIENAMRCDLIEEARGSASGYRTTDRGRAYVEALKAVPFPIARTVWVQPESKT